MASRSKQLISSTEKHQSNLNNLLIYVTSSTILAFPDFQLLFILHINTLAKGLRYALYQTQEEQICVLGYVRRTLVAAINKYHSSKIEFLASKWNICEHFIDYLNYSPHSDAYTDFNPIFTSTKVNARGQLWVNEMSNFSFSIHYKPGIENVVADSLTRYPLFM